MNDRAREMIRHAVITLSRESGAGPVTRPVFRDRPDDDLTRVEPEPLAGIRAAVALRHAITRVLSECARYAREGGSTWSEIGDPLGLSAADAYWSLASSLGDGMSFIWTCPACRKLIIDRGPEAGSPADAEQGHDEGCGRIAQG